MWKCKCKCKWKCKKAAESKHQFPLHEAAKRCDVSTLKKLLKEGNVNVNGKNGEHCTALYYVISREWGSMGVEACRSLCEHGADVNEKLDKLDHTKPSYLFTAMCEYSHGNYQMSIIEVLLKAGANPNVTNNNGKTPLYMACYYKRADVVDLLLAYGANVNICDSSGCSPLHAAVQWCNPFDRSIYSSLCNDATVACAKAYSVVQRLLNKGAVVNLKNHEGNIPLHVAISNNKRRFIDIHCDDIDTLLHNKSDIYAPSGFEGLDTLQLAAKNGKNLAVKFCLDSGMNPNIYPHNERSPLNLAVKGNYPEVVTTLLQYGAQIRNFRGDFSVLHTASVEGLPDMVRFLIELGANPKEGNSLHWIQEYGKVPLLVAAHVNAAKTLVAGGATLKVDPDSSARARQDDGLPTLHFFLRSLNGHTEYRSKLCTIFYNPHLQHRFSSDIFLHLVKENAIQLSDDREICFQLEWRHLKQFVKNTCPIKLGILRLTGVKLKLFSSMLRAGPFLISCNKLCQNWKELYYQLRQPISLKVQCRTAIRRTMPAPLSLSVGRLPYPKCMQEYLMIPEIEHAAVTCNSST